MKPLIAAVAVLVALAVGVQAQTPLIDRVRTEAEQGDVVAQGLLGDWYHDGDRVSQDHVEAVRWYRLAADQGDAAAQVSLGNMYDNGLGVQQDDVQAHMWFNLAASQLTGEARELVVENRDWVAFRMTPEQIAEAERLAREWNEAHPRE